MEWTNEKVLTLIDLYRDRPVLWDCRSKQHKDRNRRTDALMEIAVSFGVEKEEIDRKIKNLMCHLSRELKKERDGKKCGTRTGQAYKSKWFCYDSMLFLKNRNGPRGMTYTHNMQGTAKDKQVTRTDTQNVDQVEKNFEHSSSTSETRGEKNIKTQLAPMTHAIPRSKEFSSSATREAVSKTREIKERHTSKDQYTVFGEQVGMRIRDLPSPHAKNIVKHLISTTLFEAEMGKYDNPISFPNTYSQSSQQSYSSTLVPGLIYNSPPLLPQSSYSSQIPVTLHPKQEAISPESSYPYNDSDSPDSILIDS